MKLQVPFNLTITVVELTKNYSGFIQLFPAGLKSRTFYFLMIHPYDGTKAEFSIFQDKELTLVLSEGIGKPSTQTNPNTSLPIVNFDFNTTSESPEVGLVYVLSQIISEGIYHTELAFKQGKLNTSRPIEFNHRWEQEFNADTIHLLQTFLAQFEVIG